MAIEKYTTKAFVLQAFDQGEHDRVYKLFTRDFGVIMAHAKSIRKLESKLRAHLQTPGMSLITVVKGREVWRVTGATEMYLENTIIHDVSVLVTRLMRGEGAHIWLFDALCNVISEAYIYDAQSLRVLIYYIVLVDLGYADFAVLGAKDIKTFQSWTIAELYTHLMLTYPAARKHIHGVLRDMQL